LIEAFRIGVLLDMQSNAAPVLSVVNREILGVHQGVTTATAALGQFRLAFAGLGATGGGGGVMAFMRHMETAGEALARSQAILQTALGGTAAAEEQVAEATRRAGEAMRGAMVMLPRFQRVARMADQGGGAAFLAARMTKAGATVAAERVGRTSEAHSATRTSPPLTLPISLANAGSLAPPRAEAWRHALRLSALRGPAPGTSVRSTEATTVRGLKSDQPSAAVPIEWVTGRLMPALKAHAADDTVGRVFTDRTVAELARGIILARSVGAESEAHSAIRTSPPPAVPTGMAPPRAEVWRNALRFSALPVTFNRPAAPGEEPAPPRAEVWRNALRFSALPVTFNRPAAPGEEPAPPPASATARAFATPRDDHDDAPRGVAVPQAPKTEVDANASLPPPHASHSDSAPFIIIMDGREIARGLAQRADGALTGAGGFDGRRNMLATT
jgi:hypothetical protein